MKIKQLPANPHKADWVSFTGGLDITSPQITIPPGYCRLAQNVEEDILGGYLSLTGYERFSGQFSPSSAVFYLLNYTGSAAGITVGSTITGSITGSTGYILAITPTQFILTAITGTWSAAGNAETLVGFTTTVIEPIGSGEAIDSTNAYYQFLSANYYRSLIGKVGGSLCSNDTVGVIGVWYYKGLTYAFRNLNAGGVGMFVSSSSGWQQVPLGYEVYYTAGHGTEPSIGNTIVQGGVNGVLTAITIESGTFAAGTAAGRLIFSTISGTFSAGSLSVGSTVFATFSSQDAITIPNQSGRFEFVTDNFFGSATTNKMYGVDGKNRGFEFDGTTFVPINTGSIPDTPAHVTIHQGFLIYGIQGSIVISSTGNPYNWQAINGAVEIGLSDICTSLIRQPGNESSPALGVYCRNHTYMLYGNTSTTWNLVNFNDTAGAIAYSGQKIGGHTFVYDDRGVTNLQASLIYGNFQQATISQRVKTFLAQKRNSFTDSHIMRDKQQYRLFFNDGSGVYITLGTDINSFMPTLFPDTVLCSVSLETYSGSVNSGGPDIVFFGAKSGYVMQMEKGTSFDGQPITYFMDLVFNNTKAYRLLKRYRRATLEMIGTGYAEFNTSYDLNYASTDYGQPDYTVNDISLLPVNWDSGISWDSNVTWDGNPLTNISMAIEGDGMNIAYKISSSSAYFFPVKFSGVLLEYSPQRMLR